MAFGEKEIAYDNMRDGKHKRERRYKEYLEIFKMVKIKPELKEGMRVLDLGCGKGWAVYDIALEVGPKGMVVGADIVADFKKSESYFHLMKLEKGLKMPRKYYKALTGATNFVRLDAEKLPFGDRTFDAIFVIFSFDYFLDKISVVNEMLRILKPDGKIYVVTRYGRIFATKHLTKLSGALVAKLGGIDPFEERLNDNIELALKELVGNELVAYNLASYLRVHFTGLEINFRRYKGTELYEITKRWKVHIKEDRPKYSFAFPYTKKRKYAPDITFYNTVGMPR